MTVSFCSATGSSNLTMSLPLHGFGHSISAMECDGSNRRIGSLTNLTFCQPFRISLPQYQKVNLRLLKVIYSFKSARSSVG